MSRRTAGSVRNDSDWSFKNLFALLPQRGLKTLDRFVHVYIRIQARLSFIEYVGVLGPKRSSPFKGTDRVSLHHSDYIKERVTVLTTHTFIGSSVRCRVLDRRGQESHADTTVAVHLFATSGTRAGRRNTLSRAVLSNRDSPANI